MKTINQSITHLSIFFMGLVVQVRVNGNLFMFKRQIVPELEIRQRDVGVMYFLQPDERQKVCLYAQHEGKFVVHRLQPRSNVGRQELMITYIQPTPIEEFTFDTEIRRADSANRHVQILPWFNQSKPPTDLKDDDRKNLCDAARKHISDPLYFLDHNVPKMESYDFKYFDEKPETAYAISCPTLPQLFLLNQDVGKKFKLILVSSFIDNYEFELDEDMSLISIRPWNGRACSKSKFTEGSLLTELKPLERTNLCNIARRYYAVRLSPFVEDTDVSEAQLHSFRYSQNEEERPRVALHCPKLPSMYLSLDDFNEKTKIKITFAPNLADRFDYKVKMILYLGEDDDVGETERRKLLREHSFAALTKEDCWNLCSAAQKYLFRNPEEWTFLFPTDCQTFAEHWIFLIPEFLGLPKARKLRCSGEKRQADLLIQCSELPKMYLRRGESNYSFEILFHRTNLDIHV